MTKTIGLIGGVSWESTLLYYKLINESTRTNLGGLNSARILINSLNYAPIVQLEREDNWPAVTNILTTAAKTLEHAGANFILLACNTLHKVADAIESSIKIPFIHIADPAGESFQQSNIKTIGLLGTQFTMEETFYTHRLQSKYNLTVITPPKHQRKSIDNIIYNELCLGLTKPESKSVLLQAIQTLQSQGAEGILLACTELGMLITQQDATIPVLDTTLLHTEKAISLAL